MIKKIKEWKKTCHANTNLKIVGVDILKSYKLDFRAKNTTCDNKKHFVLVKRTKPNHKNLNVICWHLKICIA